MLQAKKRLLQQQKRRNDELHTVPAAAKPKEPLRRAPAVPFEVRQISPDIGKGLVATKPIKSGSLILQEAPLIAAQQELNRKFVAACANCFRYLASNDVAIADYLPESKKYLPPPYKPTEGSKLPKVTSFSWIGRTFHYCSSNCMDQHWHSFLNPFYLGEGLKKVNDEKHAQVFQTLCSDWEENLPMVPFELVLRAIGKEVVGLNPTNKEMTGRKPAKRKLNLLADFKQISVKNLELSDIFTRAANFVAPILTKGEMSTFTVDSTLIEDTVRRILANHQYMVVKAPRSMEDYMMWALGTNHADSLSQVEKQLEERNADLSIVWQPVIAGLYKTQSCANHSCIPNAIVASETHDTSLLDLVAIRDIPAGSEITISYIKELRLPYEKRKSLLQEDFGFTCQCPKCKARR